MRTLNTDENGDIFCVHGRLQIATGLDAYRVAAECAARTVIGEAIFDIERGVNYDRSVFSDTNLNIFEASMRKTLLNVPHTVAIKSLLVDVEGDTLKYTAELQSDYGDLSLNGSL